jgi:hypothetical protein
MINNNNNNPNAYKELKKFWLGRGCINYIINWNAGLDAFGDKRTSFEERKR